MAAARRGVLLPAWTEQFGQTVGARRLDVDDLAGDRIVPEQAHHGDTGETVLPLGLPSMVDELLQRSAVDLLM